MPIIIPKNLPASKTMKNENIFIMNEDRAEHQDIRPIKILILNLMPTKIETETQLIRLLSNTPLQLSITLMKTNSYKSKNTKKEHLETFYKTFEEIKNDKYDGMIITGAPVETLDFEEVQYWPELTEIMDYSKKNVTSTLHICWGAQAGLYYHYGINKNIMKNKLFGVYKHKKLSDTNQLLRGFDNYFYAPHSRYTTNKEEDFKNINELVVLAKSKKAGVLISVTKDMKQIFVTGHLEYDKDTLFNEYLRDLKLNPKTQKPKNYFKNNNVKSEIKVKWRSHSYLLFSNWINYCVYQTTPFEL